MSPAMVKKVMASLGSLIAEAMDRDLVARNVVRDTTRSRKKRKGTSRQAQAQGWRGHTGSRRKSRPSWRTPRAVGGLCSWLRPSLACELLSFEGLRWADVDLKANKLHVTQRADKFHKIGPPKI